MPTLEQLQSGNAPFRVHTAGVYFIEWYEYEGKIYKVTYFYRQHVSTQEEKQS